MPLYIDSENPILFIFFKICTDLSFVNFLLQIEAVLSGLLSSTIIISLLIFLISVNANLPIVKYYFFRCRLVKT